MRNIVLVGACLALAACQNLPSPAQTVYAAEEAYISAAHAEMAVAPLLSVADRATMKRLDAQAYAEVKRLRVPAASGSVTAVDAQAAMDAVNALASFVGRVR